MSSKKKQARTTAQSVLISNKKYSLPQAIEWIKSHGYKVHKVDKAKGFYRFRQQSPKKFNSFRAGVIEKDGSIIIIYGIGQNKK